MQKRILSMVLMVMMLVTMLPANISFAAEGILAGSGTLSSPYLVSDAADLEKLADAKPGEVYKLTSDITLSRDFKTISSFKGILDGNGKTISGIDVMCEVTYVTTSSDTGYYQNSVTGQLFGTIDENAAVYNLILDKPKFSNLFKDMPSGKTNIHQYKLGMLANENNGIIDSVTINEINAILSPKRSGTTGSGFGSAEFGGMVYNNNGTIVNSKVQKGAIHTSEGSGVDGIVRNNYGTVASTISTVSVDINTWSGYNGIRSTYLSLGVGRNYGTIHNV